EDLSSFLAAGYQLELVLQPYTSLLASGAYNEQLRSRRVSSIINAMREEGLGTYLDQGQLQVIPLQTAVDRQEYKLGNDDNRHSIYEITNMQKRRVDIVRINIIDN
ncbi:MAG: hypothetical protein AAGJ93_09935, partial [Bacteroidota bacterium]